MAGKRAFFVTAISLAMVARAEAVETGRALPDVTLRRADAGTAPLVERGSAATVAVFFRTGQERSEETLRTLAECAPRLAGKPVRFVGVVPADSAAGAPGALAEAKLKLPVLVDEGDALYAAAGIRTHPAILILDRARKVVAFEQYREVGACEVLVALVRRQLGEISDAEVAKAEAPGTSAMPGDDPSGVARRQVSFGRKLLQSKAYAAAHESARKALQIAPLADAWRLEAEVFAAEGRCAEANQAFDKAAVLDRGGSAARPACGR